MCQKTHATCHGNWILQREYWCYLFHHPPFAYGCHISAEQADAHGCGQRSCACEIFSLREKSQGLMRKGNGSCYIAGENGKACPIGEHISPEEPDLLLRHVFPDLSFDLLHTSLGRANLVV